MKKIERRVKQRYPIDLGIRFIAMTGGRSPSSHGVIRGTGQIMNISSSGILFRSAIKVPNGSAIRVDVAWPLCPDERTALSLIGSGRVIRSRPPTVAVRIGHFDFAPRPSASGSPLVIVADIPQVQTLVFSAAARHGVPVFPTRNAADLLKRFPDESRLLVVTNDLTQLAGTVSRAFIINTNYDGSEPDVQMRSERTLHVRTPLNPEQFQAVVESALRAFCDFTPIPEALASVLPVSVGRPQ